MATKKKTSSKKIPIGKGKIGFETAQEIRAPLKTVWEAVTKAKHTQKFFMDKTTGDFTKDLKDVTWYWKKWGTHIQHPVKYVEGKSFTFHWLNHKKKYYTTVRFTLSHKSGITKISIKESGWTLNDIKNAFDNCAGWSGYVDYLKAYVLWGKDMRTYKGK